MLELLHAAGHPLPYLRIGLSRALAIDRSLTLVGLAMVGLLIMTLVGLLVDPRTITGVPAWLKPSKFAASFTLYTVTLIWLLHFIQGRLWVVRVVATLTALVAVVEVAIISVQAARGTTSHFNQATEADALLFSIMGGAITVLWLMGLLLAGLLLTQRLPDAAFAWSLRLGLLVALVGMAIGFLMTRPTPAQQMALAAGERVPIVGAHSVGAADGGPGLPVVNWSTTGGDLRAPHFIGLHALQAIPLIGWLVTRRGRGLGPGHRLALVWVGALAYLSLVLALTWQALRGQPLISPDSATFAGMFALGGATAALVGIIMIHSQRTAKLSPS
jgi:hypothetical protein